MPPRKSETRRSDASTVSISRFEPMEDTTMADTTAADTTMAMDISAAPELPEGSPSSIPGPAAPGSVGDKEKKDKEKEGGAVTIEDLSLPKSIITRLAKGVLPPNTQIQANAILALSKSATVFVSHLANAANEYTTSSGKKTIMPDDVFKALVETEFEFMVPALQAEFNKFFSIQSSKRSTYRRKVAAAKKAGDTSVLSTGSTDAVDNTEASMLDAPADGEDAEHKAKKVRTDDSAMDASEVNGEENVPSDAETVPDETEVDEDQDDEEDPEEDPEEDENEQNGDETDKLEDCDAAQSGDEALDDDDSE